MTIKDYSSTAASNTAINGIAIAGTAAVSNMDDGLRNVMSDISNWTDADTLASGTTTDLGSVQGMYVTVSGTATITGFGTLKAGMVKFVYFSGAGTLTHNATSMILPGAANIARIAGDTAVFVAEGAGNWRCLNYYRAALGVDPAIQPSVDVASAATTDIGAASSQYVRITGTTTITSLGTATAGTFRRVQFAASLILTHNSATLYLPGQANITTTAVDVAEFMSTGSGNWVCVSYMRNAPPVIATGTAPTYACRAWVNFAGATGTISGSGNVASVVRNSTGNYTVTLTTALPDANYSAVASHSAGTTNNGATVSPINSSSFTIITSGNGVLADPLVVCASVFR